MHSAAFLPPVEGAYLVTRPFPNAFGCELPAGTRLTIRRGRYSDSIYAIFDAQSGQALGIISSKVLTCFCQKREGSDVS